MRPWSHLALPSSGSLCSPANGGPMTSRWSNSVLLIAILLLLGVELLGTFALMVPAFVARWLLCVIESHWLAIIAAVFAMSVLVLTVIVLIWRAFGGATVTADTIAGAVCAYLILGGDAARGWRPTSLDGVIDIG